MTSADQSVRYAVVGLGYFAQAAVLPAFARLRNAKLAALVSGDPEKLATLGDRYDVVERASYAEYGRLLASRAVDAVYIALPNSLHADYAVRAANAGVHVLCEKPLAVTEGECLSVLTAARSNEVKLMVAYRLHFEAANLVAIEAIRRGRIGDPRSIDATFTMQVREGNIRLRSDLGGGPLRDVGIYCINAARYLFQDEPTEVFAFGAHAPHDPRFTQVDEQVAALMRFPSGRLASFTVGFGSADVSRCEVVGTEGSLRLDPAFHHASTLKVELRGKYNKRRSFRKRDQVAAEIEYFSECVLQDREPEPSGREGLADVRILTALQTSIESGAPIILEPLLQPQKPDASQERHIRPHGMPELVHASSPSK